MLNLVKFLSGKMHLYKQNTSSLAAYRWRHAGPFAGCVRTRTHSVSISNIYSTRIALPLPAPLMSFFARSRLPFHRPPTSLLGQALTSTLLLSLFSFPPSIPLFPSSSTYSHISFLFLSFSFFSPKEKVQQQQEDISVIYCTERPHD